MVSSEEERILLSYFLCHSLKRERSTGHLTSFCKVAHMCAACQRRAKVLAFLVLVLGNRSLPFNKVTHAIGNSCQIENKDESSSIKRWSQT